MQLKQLKIAGFKSFVDPTVIPFPSQRVGIVGPNGCGKSNIIDAVRWVMGESLARNLRGESMTDVIFKGSTQRKPVSQASVELVFDNSSGRLTGQYASYQEVAVKRVVTLDGDSNYYLNGTRCRRRDITDVFLGTGAGARGYSIIGQDTITRIIEARPEELRVYFEEAAGISKYKERKRETLSRMDHTRENLARVSDIREELNKQLLKLEKQARAAEQYTILKQEEQRCRAKIVALKWQAEMVEHQQMSEQVKQLSLEREQQQAEITHLMKNHELEQVNLHEASTKQQLLQQQLYQQGTEIARLEETLQQRQREKHRLSQDIQQVQSDLQWVEEQLTLDRAKLVQHEINRNDYQIQLEALHAMFESQQIQLEDVQQLEYSWNQQWQDVQSTLHEAERNTQLAQLQLDHLNERYQHILIEIEKKQQETLTFDIQILTDELSDISQQHAVAIATKEEGINLASQIEIDVQNLRQQISVTQQNHNHLTEQIQTLSLQLTKSEALQQAALGYAQSSEAQHDTGDDTRLVDLIDVSPLWQPVCEALLKDDFQAIIVDDITHSLESISQLKQRTRLLIQALIAENTFDSTRLIDHIHGFKPASSHYFQHILTAETIQAAVDKLPGLAPWQSVITPDGYWLGHGWLRVLKLTMEEDTGIFLRKKQIEELRTKLYQMQIDLKNINLSLDHQHIEFGQREQDLKKIQQTITEYSAQLHTLEIQRQHKHLALEQHQIRLNALHDSMQQLHDELENTRVQREQTSKQYQLYLHECETISRVKEALLQSKTEWESALFSTKRNLDDVRQNVHQVELQCERETSRMEQLSAQVARAIKQQNLLQSRLEKLTSESLHDDNPDEALKTNLTEKIQAHTALTVCFTESQQQLHDIQDKIKALELAQKQVSLHLNQIQEQHQQLEIKAQACQLRATNWAESLATLNVGTASSILAGLDESVPLINYEQSLLDVDDKIRRLGAINLLAIEEYKQDLERKTHLDQQFSDLTEALTILELAIAKMDKETELRLKDTFEQINSAFQSLFPRLFGGGYAKLELTCGNLLEAGILVMAQPPGKRNSTIHMLSGGEKAMTAVALVFAIFQLNPSPFCLLDEVDAPLDEANVRRFCDLVKEMSACVQFLFITHNKVTMEVADHLIGVTMREPGVSRIVAVDVESVMESMH